MTIAAGFKLKTCLFVCTDSLYTDGFTKHYGTKIFKGSLGQSKALFALAGSVSHARTFIQHLENVMHGKIYALPLLRETLSHETANFYSSHKDSIGDSGLQLVIAIRHPEDGFSLMICDNSACYESLGVYEFVGCGRSVAKPFADWMYPATKTDKDRVLMAVTVLNAIKWIDPNCDGNTQYGILRLGDQEPTIDERGLIEMEGFGSNFFGSAADAFFACAKHHTDAEVDDQITRLGRIIRMLHDFPGLMDEIEV